MADEVGYDALRKTIVLGDSGVGKSALILRFARQEWNPILISTIGVDFLTKTFHRGPAESQSLTTVVKVQFWDTAGQERFRSMVRSHYRGVQGIMLVFDVTKRDTLEELSNWIDDLRNNGVENNVPMVLVGNKTDCPSRQVPQEEGRQFAESIGSRYFETSAKEEQGVQEAFEALVDVTLEKFPPPPTVNQAGSSSAPGQQQQKKQKPQVASGDNKQPAAAPAAAATATSASTAGKPVNLKSDAKGNDSNNNNNGGTTQSGGCC